MSVTATVLLDVMDLSGVFCVADSGVLQDTFLWNSMRMHTCSVWFSNSYLERGTGRAVKTAKADRGTQDDQKEEVKDLGRKRDREAPSRAQGEPTMALEEQVTGSHRKVHGFRSLGT